MSFSLPEIIFLHQFHDFSKNQLLAMLIIVVFLPSALVSALIFMLITSIAYYLLIKIIQPFF